MSGEMNLNTLLKSMKPILCDGDFVFCVLNSGLNENIFKLDPICIFHETEGLTIIIEKDKADQNNLPYGSIFRMITLSVHSSLDAIGFLAVITTKLAEKQMSVNPVSAYYHDHIFVPAEKALIAMEVLEKLSSELN